MSKTVISRWPSVLTSVIALLSIPQAVAAQQNEIPDQSRRSISAAQSTEAAKPSSVTIVEYSDFQCPYCKRAASVVSQVKAAYGDGVNLVFKQMPLPFHQYAFKAAQASVCSAQAGKFWEFHDRVFASTDLSVDALKQIASEAGLKVGEFNACMDSEASRDAVQRDLQEASQLGVTGTPTFFINGRKLVGAISLDVFKREIDREIIRTQNPTPPEARAKSIDPTIEIMNGDNALVDGKNAGVQRAVRAVVTAANQSPQATATVTSTGVSLSPGSVAFGYQLVGTTSNQIVETVTNLSNTPLIITDISVSGRDRRDFTTSYSFRLPVTVAPGHSIAINLTFTPVLPWRAGTRNARLEIAEKKDSQYVTLTGIGATCGGLLPACSSGCADSDGDGLNDACETAGGIDLNNDGRVDAANDLLLPGADPNKPDIYVQYDWMDYGLNDVPCASDSECSSDPRHAGETCTGPATPYSANSCVHACVVDSDCTGLGPSHVGDRCVQNSCEHTHDPEVSSPGALHAVVDAFGDHGFNLHILRGRAVPHSHVVSFRTPEANCEGASVSPGTLGAYAVNLYDLKKLSFDQGRSAAFHYSIFGHLSTCDNATHCDTPLTTGTCPTVKGSRPQLGASGHAELPGNDFSVSLGHFVSDLGGTPRISILAGTFMHELGHNFGLHHGGGTSLPGTPCIAPDCEDAPQFKPNYLSVMNYRYQNTGIPEGDAVGSSAFRSCSTDADCPTSSGARCEHLGFGGICLRLDYSTQVLPTGGNTPGALWENGQLNEPAGLGSGTSDLFTFDDGTCTFQVGATQGPANWDGIGLPDNPNATSDLNVQDHPSVACTVTSQVHRGHTDWGPAPGQSIFTMAFQCTPNGLADGAAVFARVADKLVADSGPFAQGELSPEMAAAAHVLYPPRPVRLQIDPEPPLTQQSDSRPSTRTGTLLGTEDLDVTEIEQTSLRVGSLVPLSVSVRDVDGDGRADLVIEFDAIQLTSRANAEKIRVSGWLKNSQVVVGIAELTSKRVSSSEIAPPGTVVETKQQRVSASVTTSGVSLSPGSISFGYQLVGERLGVTGTPTFIINGKKIVRALSFEAFRREIDQETVKSEATPAKSISLPTEREAKHPFGDDRNAGVKGVSRPIIATAQQQQETAVAETVIGMLATANHPTLSIGDVIVSEASCISQAAVFTVTISAPYGKNVTVQYATANGTAIAGTDYTAVSGTLTFPRGSKAPQTITVPIADVLIPGPNKNFFVNLSSPVNVSLTNSQGAGTIQPPSVAKCQSCNLSCDDGNPCTRDSCSATVGCKQVNASATATPYCTLAGLGITPAPDPNFATCHASGEWLDSDGDGFSDVAEIQGYIDVNGNEVYDPGVDVPLPGANPHVSRCLPALRLRCRRRS